MKKRWVSIVLLLALILSMLPLPAQAATPEKVYNYLVSYAKKGTLNKGNYERVENRNGLPFTTVYYPKNDMVAIQISLSSIYSLGNSAASLRSGHLISDIAFKKSMTTPYEGRFVYTVLGSNNNATLAYCDIYPEDYSAGDAVSLSSISGNEISYSQAKDLMSTLMAKELDYLDYILQLGGYSLRDLGFTHYNDPYHDDPPIENCDHKYDSGKVSTEPTCLLSGIKVFTCTICGYKRYEKIPALGHQYTLRKVISEGSAGEHGSAQYECSRCGNITVDEYCTRFIFTDVPAKGNWAHNGIDWAYFNGVTNGTSGNTFSPNAGCTRAQVVTFLWRAMGSSAPKNTVNPFRDVVSGDYYYNAVLWAVENGITKGTDTSHFTPDKTCTRGEIVTFLWRSVGKPDPRTASHSFTDVVRNAFYYDAMLWAVENEVTNGTSSATFSPDGTCTRAQVVTFLYRALKTISDNALEQAIQEAEAIRLNNYIPDSRQPLIDALAAGKALMEQGGYTREEADAAAEAIRLAISALISNPDRRSLAATIRGCSGYDESKYTAVSWQALQTELAAAQEVMDNPNATQEMINTAESALTRAMKQLEIKEELLTGTCGDQVTWTLSRGARVLRISGTGKMRDYRSGDYTPWYQYESYIDAVVIDEGVTRIGRGAFHHLTQLTDISFPASVAIIGPFAFNGCTSLTELTIPDTVTEIGYDAFLYCPSLKKVTLPKGLTYIADELFCNCNYLEEITIPEGVTVIGSYAFKGCGTIDYIDKRYVALGMKSVTIPKSVMSIEESAFGNCFALTDVYYGGSADDWAKISIGSDNEDLEEATIHFAK